MKAYRVFYEGLPSSVEMPPELTGERVEMILLVESNGERKSPFMSEYSGMAGEVNGEARRIRDLAELYGAIPDMPDRDQPTVFDESEGGW
jgi:hypothetical protein